MEEQNPKILKMIIFMLIYSILLLVLSKMVLVKLFSFFMPGIIYLKFLQGIGLVYLVSSIGLLSLKNWGRLIAVYISAFLSVLIVIWILMFIRPIISGNLTLSGPEAIGMLGVLFTILIVGPCFPAPIFFIFFTRPNVKEQFK